MNGIFTRRELLKAAGAATLIDATLLDSKHAAEDGLHAAEQTAGGNLPDRPGTDRFRYCLNTSTIRGQNLTLSEQIAVAAKAGYDAIEPWMRDIHRFVEAGGKLDDIRRQLEDCRLEVPSAIGFASWIVDDPRQRAEGIQAARRDMEALRAIGGTRLAAPPVGATDRSDLDLRQAAERYRALLEIGMEVGVIPQLELWGFSKTLSRLGEVAFVAAEAGHPASCVLLDVYHIYKGGSDFAGLRLFSRSVLHVLHVNDYPAEPPRASITDAHRVYPGDGVAPLNAVFRMLDESGVYPVLSLELFNAEYWKLDPLLVAQTGLAKMRQAVQRALASQRGDANEKN